MRATKDTAEKAERRHPGQHVQKEGTGIRNPPIRKQDVPTKFH